MTNPSFTDSEDDPKNGDNTPFNVIDLKAEQHSLIRKDGELICDRYRVDFKLAETGISTVYLAEDQRLGRKVVLKHLHKTEDDSTFSELLREAQILSALNHPNILTVFDSTSDDKGAYIVTEYIQGDTIADFAQKQRLSPQTFWDLAFQMMEGLVEAHHRGIIHGDIKSNNIMISTLTGNRFQVKILDFGLANLLNKLGKTERINSGQMLGSAYFMAPEQFENKATTSQTDLYSMGCVCYHALTGAFPFQGENAMQIMTSHLQHAVHDIAILRPDLPSMISQWIMWMINLTPETRPKSAAEALDLLKKCNPERLEALATEHTQAASEVTDTRPIESVRSPEEENWLRIRKQAQKSLARLINKRQAVVFMDRVMEKQGIMDNREVQPEMYRTLITDYFTKVPNRAKQKALLEEMEAHF